MSRAPMPHITTICQVRFPKLENRLANVFRKFIFLTSLCSGTAARKKTSATVPCLWQKSQANTWHRAFLPWWRCHAAASRMENRKTALYSLLSNVVKQKTGELSRRMQRSFLYLILLKTPVALFQQFIDFFVVLDVFIRHGLPLCSRSRWRMQKSGWLLLFRNARIVIFDKYPPFVFCEEPPLNFDFHFFIIKIERCHAGIYGRSTFWR